MSDFPIFSGRYSTFAYVDETALAVENMLEKLGVSPGKYYRGVRGLFFHRPYNQMPIQAMSFLHVRGMARGVHHHDELRELCQEALVAYDQVIEESRSAPDLFAQVLESGQMIDDPYPGTSAVAAVLRKRSSFRELLAEKVGWGSKTVIHLGNLYSAALPAWLAAGFEEAEQNGIEIAESPMVAIGYGSGDAAEAIPIYPVKGWQEAAKKIKLKESLADPIDLRCPQYEALHDGRELVDLEYVPRQEFVISHVGGLYERGFQDLAVEYYDYVL
jgi:hydroxymethylglutaryl-CoA synthase